MMVCVMYRVFREKRELLEIRLDLAVGRRRRLCRRMRRIATGGSGGSNAFLQRITLQVPHLQQKVQNRIPCWQRSLLWGSASVPKCTLLFTLNA